MVVTDPISDMICRMKNAIQRSKLQVDMPSSKVKEEIARLLKDEGYIENFKTIEDTKQNVLRIYLKYTDNKESVIRGIKRVSKPGGRKYVGLDQVPRVIEGLGRAILSTSKGMLTDKGCRKNGVGGEVILNVW